MKSSFEGSATSRLIRRAEELRPDFSSRPKQIPCDEVICEAPAMMGKFLALKKQLMSEEAALVSNEERLRANRADQSLCSQLASLELREAIRTQPRRKCMSVRNTGMIVVICESHEAIPQEMKYKTAVAA